MTPRRRGLVAAVTAAALAGAGLTVAVTGNPAAGLVQAAYTAPCADPSETCQDQRLAALEAAVAALSPSPPPTDPATPDPTTPTATASSSTPALSPTGVDTFGWDGVTLPPPRLTGGGNVAQTGDARLPWHTNTGLYDPARRASVLAKPAVALKVASGTPGNPRVYTDVHASSVDYTGAHDFLIAFSVIEGQVVGSTGGGPCPGCWFVHDDIGNGRGGGQHLNSKGNAAFYRNNVFGYLDGISPWNATGEVVIQDNFIHDLEWQPDSTQSSGHSHNDDVQPKKDSGTTTMRYNTLWAWMFNGATQRAARDSGPNWYKSAAAAASATGGHDQTSGVLSGSNYPARRLNLYGNLFRGAAEHYVQHRGTGGDCVGNLFSSTESAAGAVVVGSESRQHFTRVSGNTYWAGDVRAGQAVAG